MSIKDYRLKTSLINVHYSQKTKVENTAALARENFLCSKNAHNGCIINANKKDHAKGTISCSPTIRPVISKVTNKRKVVYFFRLLSMLNYTLLDNTLPTGVSASTVISFPF